MTNLTTQRAKERSRRQRRRRRWGLNPAWGSALYNRLTNPVTLAPLAATGYWHPKAASRRSPEAHTSDKPIMPCRSSLFLSKISLFR